MAVWLLGYQVADLCLGKPPLRPLSVSATVADVLAALKSSDDRWISVWSCNHHHSKFGFSLNGDDDCRCVGKVCMVDVICFICREENLSSPSSALKSPVSALLSTVPGRIKHVESSWSLLEAIDLILQGAQNLVVPIRSNYRRKLQKSAANAPTVHNGREFCWLTVEDVVRFLLSSIGLFSPIPSLSIDSLGIITTEFLAIGYNFPASAAVAAISRSLADQTSVAVIDEDDGILIGEISPITLACCDESVAAAIATLLAGDLMAYIDCGGPPEDIVRTVMARLKQRNLDGMLEEFAAGNLDIPPPSSSSSSSSDEESPPQRSTLQRSTTGRFRRAEPVVCHPGSSLAAVMIQAIAHRVNYVWVIEEDCRVAGIVTFHNILAVFRNHLDQSP